LISIITDDRNRLFFGLADRQTAQSQLIMGTPPEVPVPKNVMRMLKPLFLIQII
jgi:hypothetical protein